MVQKVMDIYIGIELLKCYLDGRMFFEKLYRLTKMKSTALMLQEDCHLFQRVLQNDGSNQGSLKNHNCSSQFFGRGETGRGEIS